MRVTNSMYYKNVFAPEKSRLSENLLKVNKEISSGLKIEYAKDDVSIFSNTMRLDNEIVTLTQAAKSTTSALKMATQTDKTLNDVQTTLDRMKVLMVNAANATHDDTSLDAIYEELKGLRNHLKTLSNTSINGQFIFAGSALDTKPIDNDGTYRGNDKELKAFAGSQVSIQYNIPGSDLFLGEETQTHRRVTTNIKNYNQSDLHPDVMVDPSIPKSNAKESFITPESTIRDLMGDTDNDPSNDPVSHFYLQGVRHDGTSFKKQIDMNSTQSVGELLSAIEDAYGKDSVNVTLNPHGQIEIEDRIQGSSKLTFHMVGAVDFKGADDADLNFETSGAKLEDLEQKDVFIKGFVQSGYTGYTSDVASAQDRFDESLFSINGEMLKKGDFSNANLYTPLSEIYPSNVDHISFSGTQSDGTPLAPSSFSIAGKTVQDLLDTLDALYDADDTLEFSLNDGKIVFSSSTSSSQSNIDIKMQTQDAANNAVDGFAMDKALTYDDAKFTKVGNKITGNVAQIVTADNAFATKSTKLSEVADVTQTSNTTSLDGTKLSLKGTDINGNLYTAEIDLSNSGSTFSVDTDGDGTVDRTYPIYTVEGSPRTKVKADDMTYGQLSDVMNMVVTNSLPQDTNANSVYDPEEYDAAVENASLLASVDLTYDGKLEFTQKATATTKAEITLQDITSGGSVSPAMSFQLNDALTISDPKTDFFHHLDSAIESVGLKRLRPDGKSNDPRNLGIQNAITVIDDLAEHVSKMHAKIGAYSNSLQNASQRSELLSVSTKTLRSETIDTDIAEASMRLNQLTLNYQAILSTVGRVSKLSLVNYL